MFSHEAMDLIEDILELFAQASKIPVALYEQDNNGKVTETFRSDEKLFPEHCHQIWARSGGREACDDDMCKRAKKAFQARKAVTFLCHAGLTNVTEPILVDGKAVAALQYGAFLEMDQENADKRLFHHRQAMEQLGVEEQGATRIQQLLLEETPRRAPEELMQLRQTLMPILVRTISKYIMQREQEHRMQQGAYHDLQLKLQAALAYAENLTWELAANSEQQREAENIMNAVEASATVLHSLTRGQYLPDRYRFKPHPVINFVERALALCRAEAQHKGIEIRLDLQPDGGNVAIEASEIHLQQVFNNLLQNAVKYSYRAHDLNKGRFVSVRGRPVADGYEIMITNYGIGIEADEIEEKIFTAGYKGRLTRQEYRTGSGQGLALSKRIIIGHRGKIYAASEPAGEHAAYGTRPYLTRFFVWLPFKQPDAGGNRWLLVK